jgi:hypothetical protein
MLENSGHWGLQANVIQTMNQKTGNLQRIGLIQFKKNVSKSSNSPQKIAKNVCLHNILLLGTETKQAY